MGWEDSVMTEEEILNAITGDHYELSVAKAQAEKSYKAGKRELIEWLREHSHGKTTRLINEEDWQTLLKELEG